MRRGSGTFLDNRRRIAGLTTGAAAALGAVGLYQFGVVRHLPEPPLSFLGADVVDASGEAYELLRTPDSSIGILSAGATLALAGMGDGERWRTRPVLPLLFAAKVAADAVGGLYLFAEQASKHRRFCSYCTVAALLNVAAVPLVLPEARAAWRSLRGR